MFIDIQKIAGGQPLPEGQVFIGLIGTDPVDSPVSVYSDYECTVSISTPLTLDDNGLPIDSSGNQVNLYANFDFSIQLQDKYGADFYQNYVDVKVPAASDSPAVITGERTFVVPVGESFRIVDDAENPSFQFGVSNKDIQSEFLDFGLYISKAGLPSVQSMTSVNPDTGQVLFTQEYSNDNGFLQSVLRLNADGTTRYRCNAAEVVMDGLPTYADNAAALLAGAQVGSDYNTPAGDRKVVI